MHPQHPMYPHHGYRTRNQRASDRARVRSRGLGATEPAPSDANPILVMAVIGLLVYFTTRS